MRSFCSAAMAASLAFAAETATQDSCLALALNGGGAKGAYQAGVIHGFMHEGNPDDFQWDVVTGISGGAINSCAMSVWDKTDGLAMSEWLSDKWANLHTHDVWKLWPEGPITGLTGTSLLDDTPLVEFLTSIFGQFPDGIKRDAMVGTVNANNAAYQKWFFDQIPEDKWLDLVPRACVSSASLPFLFQPQVYEGAVYIDGGTAMGLDAMTAVEQCLAKVGDDESKVTLDIILLDRFTNPSEKDDDGDTVLNMLRLHSIKSYYKGLENVITTMLAHPQVNYRYILEPSGHYPKLWNLLNFSNNNTWPMQENGRADAKTAIDAGAGESFKKFKEWIRTRDMHGQTVQEFVQEIAQN